MKIEKIDRWVQDGKYTRRVRTYRVNGADMARALEALADWPTYAAEHELPDDVCGAQEHAEMALRRWTMKSVAQNRHRQRLRRWSKL